MYNQKALYRCEVCGRSSEKQENCHGQQMKKVKEAMVIKGEHGKD